MGRPPLRRSVLRRVLAQARPYRRHVAGLRAHPAGEGVNAYLRLHGAETLELPVDSADVLADLDTPQDYEAWLKERAELSGTQNPPPPTQKPGGAPAGGPTPGTNSPPGAPKPSNPGEQPQLPAGGAPQNKQAAPSVSPNPGG